jgi:type II secretory pathway component PulL
MLNAITWTIVIICAALVLTGVVGIAVFLRWADQETARELAEEQANIHLCEIDTPRRQAAGHGKARS